MSTDDLILEVPCPLCKARAGRPCLSMEVPRAERATPHLERIQAYYWPLR